MKIIRENNKRYIIDNSHDEEIWKKVKSLEEKLQNKTEKEMLDLIKTQLESNWRKYLLIKLNKLIKKYKLK